MRAKSNTTLVRERTGFFFMLVVLKIVSGSPSWPQVPPNPSGATSQELGLHACTTWLTFPPIFLLLICPFNQREISQQELGLVNCGLFQQAATSTWKSRKSSFQSKSDYAEEKLALNIKQYRRPILHGIV